MPEKKNTIKPQKLTVKCLRKKTTLTIFAFQTKVRMKKQDFLEAKIFILW
jgi:hypothetical protein